MFLQTVIPKLLNIIMELNNTVQNANNFTHIITAYTDIINLQIVTGYLTPQLQFQLSATFFVCVIITPFLLFDNINQHTLKIMGKGEGLCSHVITNSFYSSHIH